MRFSLRDLFWAVTLVAFGVAWWIDNRTKHAAVEQAQRLHASLGLAKRWYYHTRNRALTGIQPPPPTTQPDWGLLEEPLVER
jgi:hypothetical protein